MEIIPFIFPVLMFTGIFFFVGFVNRLFFKEILSEFQVATDLPSNSVRIMELRYKNSRLRNASKMGEEGDGMVLKMMMIPPIKIPYSAFKSITHNGVYLVMSFKKEILGEIRVTLTKNQIEAFPRLRSHLMQEITKPTETTPKFVTRASLSQAIPQFNPTQLKSSASNWFRGILFLIAIFGAAMYLRNFFGF